MAFTPEQQTAIDAKGRVIVSASAGSGKTTVMIEKMIRLILDGLDVSDVLAVTFTKKAAAQMKEKLKNKLIERINSSETTEKERNRLKEQLAGVPTASVSTIHSFCSSLIRAHFFDADVSGDFRIVAGDDADSVALKNRALDKVFEEAYAEDETGDFFKLLSVYWRKKSDNNLKKIILGLYLKLRDAANYKEELLNSGNYGIEDFERVQAEILADVKKKCRYYQGIIEELEYYFKTHDGEKSETLAKEMRELLQRIIDAPDLFSASLIRKDKFSVKEKTAKREQEYVDKVSELIRIRDKRIDEILKYLAKFSTREEELNAFFNAQKIASALGKYVLKFDEEYSALKKERNILDYNDLEHISLQLLSNERILQEMRERYSYVFVDEYQDVNPVQEKLLSLIGGENVFLVGDVKQAIYSFRGSKSKYFGQKQAEYSTMGGASLKLTKNFRSSDAVLDAVNELFCSVMTKDCSDVDYALGSIMEKGGRYPLNSGRVIAHVLSSPEEKTEKKSKDEEKPPLFVYSVKEASKRTRKETIKTAQAIKQIIDEEIGRKFYDVEKGEERTIDYSDIVVLSRKKSGEIKEVALELSKAGIPVSSSAPINICEYAEVKALIDILKLLDNAKQDEPLISALLSAMGALSVNDLASIRIAYKKEKYFRDACLKYANEQKNQLAWKLQKFYALYDELRCLASVASVGEVLSELLFATQMETELLKKENGMACLNRIRRFIAESVQPEPLALHEFLTKLKNLDYKIGYSEGGGENSVQIMTMHASKGLEFPIVIVDATVKFHTGDNDEVVMDEEYGLVAKSYDEERMVRRSNLFREYFDMKKHRAQVGDELNLYYVALTRAKYGLHVLFKEKPASGNFAYANSFAELTDFIVWEKYTQYGVEEEIERQERQVEGGKPDEELVKKIIDAYNYRYPYVGAENLPVKSSATSIMNELENDNKDYVPVYKLFEKDESASGRTSKESGIAYHAFLEKFNFDLIPTGAGARVLLENVVNETLEKWAEQGVLPKEQLDLLSPEKLTEILSNPVFSGLKNASIYKERQFLVALPLKEIPAFYENAKRDGGDIGEEELLFQGAIDLLAIGEDKIVRIIDYKYSVKDADTLKKDYAPQLDLYKKATARILKIAPSTIKCSIVNLYRGFEVEL